MTIKTLLVLLACSLFSQHNHSKPSVLLLSPYSKDHPLAINRNLAMSAAAKSFGLELTIKSSEQYSTLTPTDISNLFSFQTDYIVTESTPHYLHLLKTAENRKVKILLLADPSHYSGDINIGRPREQFKSWLGSVHSNEEFAGHQLVKTLYRGFLDTNNLMDRKLTLLAFSGKRVNPVSINRKRGLISASKDLPIDIAEVFEIDWNPIAATRPLFTAMKRHPETTLFWAASDDISLEIIRKMKTLGKKANYDYVTAGIDWTPQALNSIENGEMLASIGGQFLNNCWALVLLYDYHHGLDFIDYGISYQTKMQIINKSNVKEMKSLLSSKDWSNIDFKQYTQRHNSNSKGYNFDINRFFTDKDTKK